MIKRLFPVSAILVLTLLSSCEVVAGVFEADYYAGVFAILAILVLIVGLSYYIGRR